MSRHGKLEDVSFSLGRGEILGIAGMLGSGRTELLMWIIRRRGAIRFGRDFRSKGGLCAVTARGP